MGSRCRLYDASGNQLRQYLHRITASDSRLLEELNHDELQKTLIGRSVETSDRHDNAITLDSQIALRRRGVETKLVMLSADEESRAPDLKLIQLVARSHKWLDELSNGTATSVRQLASRYSIDAGDVSRFLGLAFLAPDIVEEIVTGTQPAQLTPAKIRDLVINATWDEQRKLPVLST